jgi:xylulokinase
VLLTIDIGTSSLKSALWDYEGNRLAFASFPLSVNINDEQKCEVICGQWLHAFKDCCDKLGTLADVSVIVISGNGPTLVPVLEGHLPENELFPAAENARLWLDRRAVKYQAQVSEIMGGFVDAGFFLPKILSIKNDENELYRKVKYFLGCPEYLAYTLTGEAKTVFPSDGFDRWFWDNGVLEKLELDTKKMPSFIRPGEPFGTVLPKAASFFGLKNNIPVISGGPDFFASILGAGVTEPSQACDRTGSSEGINLCINKKVNDERLMSYGHPVKPYWNLSGIINTTGKAIEWASGILGLSGIEDFFSLAGESRAGSGGLVFLPYLAGERAPLWNPSVRGLWLGLSINSSRGDFANSILEGIGFAIRDVITVMEESGEKVKQLRVTGGIAGNDCFNQLKADITGIEILEPVQKEGELLGLAVIGSCFLSKYSSFGEASCAMVHVDKHFEPNPKNKSLYNELFEKYRNSRDLIT